MAKVVCFGEIMLRLTAEMGVRLNQAEQLAVYYGGGEANVAISLANYGHQVAYASKVADNALGQAAENHLRSYGVSTEPLLKGSGRLGTYYVEQGVGQKATKVVYDRQGSAFASMAELEWALLELFAGVDVFHVSGITPALSEAWREWTIQLMQAAKTAGCKVSFDSNYRQTLWSQEEAGKFLQTALPYVDYCSAGRLDAIHLLGIEETTADVSDYYQLMHQRFPNIQVFFSTNRVVHSTSVNELQGTLWSNGETYTAKPYLIDPIVDRIGGGDAFTGAILHGLLSQKVPHETIEFATAAAVLKHFVKGDCNQFNEAEVLAFMQSDSAKIHR
ncbi:2-dehydro-3-deoxygluconokinase [Enterococcus florum]|uniref:2-dehydro-3-deoxygluconokinase n=1 Tax=Enterococcus florum TaxID=2480627 RepID=A0A4P5PGQ8_9ENTE|nr:sugar kinase [Enterococcus florum]GCF92683.1 2-dehydro-3-deoxygluconokinase [Enterococcus florum]